MADFNKYKNELYANDRVVKFLMRVLLKARFGCEFSSLYEPGLVGKGVTTIEHNRPLVDKIINDCRDRYVADCLSERAEISADGLASVKRSAADEFKHALQALSNSIFKALIEQYGEILEHSTNVNVARWSVSNIITDAGVDLAAMTDYRALTGHDLSIAGEVRPRLMVAVHRQKDQLVQAFNNAEKEAGIDPTAQQAP